MEIISGYFISKGQAMEAAEYLRKRGFKGRISVMGRPNKEDNRENVRNYTSEISRIFIPEVTDGFPMAPLVGIVDGDFGGDITETLVNWGVPQKEGYEIRNVIESGNSVILIESEEKDKCFVRDTLKRKGAQNIHI